MTRRHWQIGRLLGIPIQVHASWFIIFVFVSWSLATGYLPDVLPGLTALRYWGMGGAAALLLFASVLLHELGHSYVALRYRIPISHITLFIFGGIAQMRREPPGPRAEFLIAVAGPLVSLCLAGLLLALATLAPGPPGVVVLGVLLGSVNLQLGLFNLIPGFPLDGGRLLRAGLWAWSGDFLRATRQAALVGQGFGVAVAVGGAMLVLEAVIGRLSAGWAANGGWVVLIGLFLFGAARGARRQAVVHAAFARERVAEVMVRDVVSLPPDLPVAEVVTRYFLRYGYDTFPVVDDGRFLGLLSIRHVQAVPQALWPLRSVQEVMQPRAEGLEAPPDLSVGAALEQMVREQQPRLAVVEDDRLVGLLTRSGIARLFQLKR